MPKDDFPTIPPQEKPPAPAAKAKTATKAAPAASSKAPSQRTKTEILSDLEGSLLDVTAKAGSSLVGVGLELPGAYLVQQGEVGTKALLRVAAKSPAMLQRLQKAEITLDYLILGLFVGGFFVALGAQFRWVPVDSAIAQTFGIDELARAFEEEAEKAAHERDVQAAGDAGPGGGGNAAGDGVGSIPGSLTRPVGPG